MQEVLKEVHLRFNLCNFVLIRLVTACSVCFTEKINFLLIGLPFFHKNNHILHLLAVSHKVVEA